VVTCGFGLGMSSGWKVAPGRSGVAESPGWTLGVVDFSREALGSLDMCHHLDAGQILTSTHGQRNCYHLKEMY